MKRLILAIAAVMLFAVSCQDEKITADIYLDKTLAKVDVAGGSVQVYVTSTTDWTVEVRSAVTLGITPEKGASGTGNMVTITVPATTSDVTTTHRVAFIAKNDNSSATKFFMITQDPLK
ncbi:MAG: hypothetical protein HUJ93_04405 [Bacteroidales bacterium]|nr:hypothetical protein [Bacteroidales bacterium]